MLRLKDRIDRMSFPGLHRGLLEQLRRFQELSLVIAPGPTMANTVAA